MARRVILLLTLALAAALVAGCGARSSKPYTAAGTQACLVKKGFTQVTTNPAKIGFIAAFAANGGLRATANRNILTIAFTADANSVDSTKQAFTSHAPAKLRPRINDIMESQGNAVLVWTVSPTAKQLADAESCLHS
jgi:hypothetical protein